MPLNALQLNTISKAMQQAKMLIEDTQPILAQINVIYNGANGLSSTITQAQLDAIPSYSGITVQELNDGMYALSSTILGGINAAYPQLCQLSVRSG